MNALPSLLLIENFGWDRTLYVEAVFRLFETDFVKNPPVFRGQPVRLKRDPLREGRPCDFWHLTTAGEDEASRTRDLERCARIRWVRWLIDLATSSPEAVRVWHEVKNYDPRWHIAMEDFSYLVVLAQRDGYVVPWTAFPVTEHHRMRKYRKAYERYMATKS